MSGKLGVGENGKRQVLSALGVEARAGKVCLASFLGCQSSFVSWRPTFGDLGLTSELKISGEKW